MQFDRRQHSICAVLIVTAVTFSSLHAQPLANGRGKFLGGGTSSTIWSGFNTYWNQVTPGNDGKWGSVEGVQGQYSFTNLDNIYIYAIGLGIPFKDHTLVWGNQQPGWIAALDSAGQRAAVEAWFRQVGERYPSMSFVDVVNEPFHAPPAYKNALGGDGSTGWDWVITAFQLARQYCLRGVKLLLNEYNILQDNTVTTNYINLITLLKDRGLIDGIGIQGHYFEFRSHVNATSNIYIYNTNTLKSNLDRLASIGLPIYITEFDVDEAVDSTQLAQYQVYFSMLWAHPGVKGITLWGYIQNDVWTSHPDTYVLRANGTERPVVPWLRRFLALPFPPVLMSPVGTSGEPRNPRLAWQACAGARNYRLQVAASGSFSPTIVDTTIVDTMLQLSPLSPNARHYWHVSATNDSGSSAYSSTAAFMTGDQVLAVEEHPGIPADYALSQNYPNPFNPSTTIRFDVPVEAHVVISVFDLLGRRLATLVDDDRPANTYSVEWKPAGLSSGVYFYRMEAQSRGASGSFATVKRLLYVK